jgi:hypothetical protein
MSDSRAKNKKLYLSYDEAKEMLENEELKRPNYLYCLWTSHSRNADSKQHSG